MFLLGKEADIDLFIPQKHYISIKCQSVEFEVPTNEAIGIMMLLRK